MIERLKEIGKAATVVAALSLPIVGIAAINSHIQHTRRKAMSSADLEKKRNETNKRKPIYPGHLGAAQLLKRGHELTRIDDELNSRNAK